MKPSKTGYDVVRKDSESNSTNGGGVCIYVHSNIHFELRADLGLKCLTIKITKPNSKPFLVSTWYRPRHLLTSFQPLSELLIKLMLKTWSHILWAT